MVILIFCGFWNERTVSQDLLETSHWEENKNIFSSLCIEVLFLMLTSISKIRFPESPPVAVLNYECKSGFFSKLWFFADFLYLSSSPKWDDLTRPENLFSICGRLYIVSSRNRPGSSHKQKVGKKAQLWLKMVWPFAHGSYWTSATDLSFSLSLPLCVSCKMVLNEKLDYSLSVAFRYLYCDPTEKVRWETWGVPDLRDLSLFPSWFRYEFEVLIIIGAFAFNL
jgi:hypothetical protein